MLARTITHKFTGEQVTFVETAAETEGNHLLIEVALPPQGDGPPLHSHRTFTEEFTVLEGVLSVKLDGRKLELAQGDKALVLLGLNHTFTNNTDQPVRFHVKLTPPSGFEESIRIHYGLMDDGLTNAKGQPKNILHLALILLLQDTLVAGVPRSLQVAILKRLVARGHAKNAYAGFEKYTGSALDPAGMQQ